MSQNGQKPTSLMTSITKKNKKKPNNFFSLQTQASFEDFNSTLDSTIVLDITINWQVRELRSGVKTAAMQDFYV